MSEGLHATRSLHHLTEQHSLAGCTQQLFQQVSVVLNFLQKLASSALLTGSNSLLHATDHPGSPWQLSKWGTSPFRCLPAPRLSTDSLCSNHIFCRPDSVDALSSKISEYVGTVTSRVESNRLTLEGMKEVVSCATSRRQHQLPCSALSVDGTPVKPMRSARDLGIYTVSGKNGPFNMSK